MNELIYIWHRILESNLFNFVLMLVLLGWIMDKMKISDKLEQGRKSIEDKIENSRLAKEDAIKQLYDLQEKSKDIQKEICEILEKSSANATLVGEKILEDARNQASEFGKNLDKLVENNTQASRNKLTEKTAVCAINVAQDYIKSRLDKEKSLHLKFINESIEALKGIEF